MTLPMPFPRQKPPSTRHDVLVLSPHSNFAQLPDLPFAPSSTTRARSSTTSSPWDSVSAPTSPLNRPELGHSSLGLITPLSLPGSSGDAMRTHNGGATTTLNSNSSSNTNVNQPFRGQKRWILAKPLPDTGAEKISSSQPSQFRGTHQAPLSSTNLASLDKSTRQRSKSRSRVNSVISDSESGSETERGGSDSDATVIDHRRIGKASYSQTDIPALKTRMTESYVADQVSHGTNAGGNGQGQGAPNGKIRDTETITVPRHGRKISPKSEPRPIPQHANSLPPITSTEMSSSKSPKSRSSTSLHSMRERKSPNQSPRHPSLPLGRSPTMSPRNSSHNLSPLTPLTSPGSMSPHRRMGSMGMGLGNRGGSDADAEYDSLTDDSSLSFTSKRRHSGPVLRHRANAAASTSASAATTAGTNGLGLSLNGAAGDQTKVEDLIPEALERLYQSSSLLYLRILAFVPACWGTLVLSHGVITGGVYHDVWPWGADFSSEAMYRRSHGSFLDEGLWKPAVRGDLILSIAWAILTGHFCFRFTTGLTYRWRSYYDLLPVIVRLLALQALCWPATYITLSYLGPSQPLFAWAVIGVSTGFTYAVIMWLASNVLPDPGDYERNSPRSKDRDRTPTRGRYRPKAPVFPVWGEAPLIAPPEPPSHLGWWDKLNYKRRWDWQAVAREVGWKVGALLLLTCAWVFWQVHIGWLVRPDDF